MALSNAERQAAHRKRRNVTGAVTAERNVTHSVTANPLSFVAPDLMAKVDAIASDMGLDRHGAIVSILEWGIAALNPDAPALVMALAERHRQRSPSARPTLKPRTDRMGVQIGPTAPKPGALLKGAKR